MVPYAVLRFFGSCGFLLFLRFPTVPGVPCFLRLPAVPDRVFTVSSGWFCPTAETRWRIYAAAPLDLKMYGRLLRVRVPSRTKNPNDQTTKPPNDQKNIQEGPAECAKRLNPPPPWCIHGAKAYWMNGLSLSKKVSPWVRAFRRPLFLQVVSDSSLRRFIFGVFSFFGASFFGF